MRGNGKQWGKRLPREKVESKGKSGFAGIYEEEKRLTVSDGIKVGGDELASRILVDTQLMAQKPDAGE